MIFLNLDENNYLLSVAKIGGGIAADIDLSEYDLTGERIRAHKWDGKTLIFDAARYAEIEAERKDETKSAGGYSVYDELAEAYKEGVQDA